jgi:hypothetical protein
MYFLKIDGTVFCSHIRRQYDFVALFSSSANGTVKNHLSNILSKMGVRDRTQAVLKAKELGLV